MRKKLIVELAVMLNVRLVYNAKDIGREGGKRIGKIIVRKNLVHPADRIGMSAETRAAIRAGVKKITI